MKIDMVVVRHESPGVAHFLTQCVDAAIRNAGDGAHEHQQALLDMFTIQQVHGSIKTKIVIVGDITHSRVVRSNIIGLKKLGAEVVLCGPKTLIPKFIDQMGAEISYKA